MAIRVPFRLSVLMALLSSGSPEDQRPTALTLLHLIFPQSSWLCIFLMTDFFCPWDLWIKPKILSLWGLTQPFICKHRSYHAMQNQNFIHHWYENIMKTTILQNDMDIMRIVATDPFSWRGSDSPRLGFDRESNKHYVVSSSGPYDSKKTQPDWRGLKRGPWG